jgi:hypothetical protein
MTTHVLQFVGLSDQERKAAQPLAKLGKGDHVEVKVRRRSGQDQIVKLPPTAAAMLEIVLGHLLQGDASRSLPRIRSSVRTTRQKSWESRDRWPCIAWTSVICHSDMSASTAVQS